MQLLPAIEKLTGNCIQYGYCICDKGIKTQCENSYSAGL